MPYPIAVCVLYFMDFVPKCGVYGIGLEMREAGISMYNRGGVLHIGLNIETYRSGSILKGSALPSHPSRHVSQKKHVRYPRNKIARTDPFPLYIGRASVASVGD